MPITPKTGSLFHADSQIVERRRRAISVLARRSEVCRLIAYLGYSGPTQTIGATANPVSAAPNDYGDGMSITLLTGCMAQNAGSP
jgi:hypothetical protein